MTVRELRTRLSRIPQDLEAYVYIQGWGHGIDHLHEMIRDVDIHALNNGSICAIGNEAPRELSTHPQGDPDNE